MHGNHVFHCRRGLVLALEGADHRTAGEVIKVQHRGNPTSRRGSVEVANDVYRESSCAPVSAENCCLWYAMCHRARASGHYTRDPCSRQWHPCYLGYPMRDFLARMHEKLMKTPRYGAYFTLPPRAHLLGRGRIPVPLIHDASAVPDLKQTVPGAKRLLEDRRSAAVLELDNGGCRINTHRGAKHLR